MMYVSQGTKRCDAQHYLCKRHSIADSFKPETKETLEPVINFVRMLCLR
jgi:hypothetical protein